MKKQYETPWIDIEEVVTENCIILAGSNGGFPTGEEEMGDMHSNQRDEKTWGNLW